LTDRDKVRALENQISNASTDDEARQLLALLQASRLLLYEIHHTAIEELSMVIGY